MSRRQTIPGKLCAISLLLTLSGCASLMASSGPTDTFCLIALPIYWSGKDTDDTIAQAKAHNAVGKTLCRWGADKPAE